MPEDKLEFKKRIYPFVGSLGVLLTILGLIFCAGLGIRHKKNETNHILELYGVRTEALLDSLFHKTDILESVIITNRGSLDKDIFDNLAEALMEGQGIRAIQCLPGGTVEYCYPLKGNEAVMGNSIFENPKRREDALLALETRQIALSGPYALTQGGFGLAARNPIFISESDGTEEFWGFSVVILDLPEALGPLMLSELTEEGYAYRLSCVVNGETVIVDQSFSDNSAAAEKLQNTLNGLPDHDFIQVDIDVPNHVWHLQAAPLHGWYSKGALFLQGLVCLIFTSLSTAIIYLLERQGMQMKQSASTDELTGLFNRRRLKEYMDIRCRDQYFTFAVFYIDLDRFKPVNDTQGHACGDAVLRETAKRIKAVLGSTGSVYRIGGDEFIAVMEGNSGRKTCEQMKAALKASIAEPVCYEDHCITISASIGYARFPEEGDRLSRLMELADTRMYQEKNR